MKTERKVLAIYWLTETAFCVLWNGEHNYFSKLYEAASFIKEKGFVPNIVRVGDFEPRLDA